MSVQSEITRLQNAKADIKTALANKSVTVPDNVTLDGYANYIDQIQAGGGSSEPTYMETETATINVNPPFTTILSAGTNPYSSVTENIEDNDVEYTFYSSALYNRIFNNSENSNHTATKSQCDAIWYLPTWMFKGTGNTYADMRDTMYLPCRRWSTSMLTDKTTTDFGVYDKQSQVPQISGTILNVHYRNLDDLCLNSERYSRTSGVCGNLHWNLYVNNTKITDVTASAVNTTYAFGRSTVESATIGGDVADYAFNDCTSLTSLTLGQASSRTIGTNAFYTAKIENALNFTEDELTIGNMAFRGNNIPTLSFSGKVSLGQQAFYGNTTLTSVSFGGETTIGANVFNGCSNLTTIRLLNSNVTFPSIGSNAFNNVPASGTIYAPTGTDVSALTNISQLSGWTVEYV